MSGRSDASAGAPSEPSSTPFQHDGLPSDSGGTREAPHGVPIDLGGDGPLQPPVPRSAWPALAVLAFLLATAVGFADWLGSPVGAEGSGGTVAPVLTCTGGMVLDTASGQCRTPSTQTALRPSTCPSGWTKVPGQYGGHVCQRYVTWQRDTGRTRQVYSHTTYKKVWVPTGTKQVQTGTKRTWVPPRTTVEPLVPPVRVKVGTTRRCDLDPVTGIEFNCRNVPVYKWKTSQTVTIPGYWKETPVYETVETGYWDNVPTIHYTTEPIYETVGEWRTTSVTSGSCASGWQPVGSQCQRTVLGDPSSAPQQSCPSGSVPRYSDPIGGMAPVLSCQSPSPGEDPDDGDDQDDSGGPGETPDGNSRSLLHLAGESDERLAELGIHRCSNGLLSYVACDELPGRTWDDDPSICDDIPGTVYKPDHGGTCVTPSDVLSKCNTPGDCTQTTIRTYCPAIGELATTEIQEHVHPTRGAETYRVCVFDCSNFSGLPSYVQIRINGSYDFACVPEEDEEEEPDPSTPGSTTTTAPSSTTTTAPGSTTTTTTPDSTTPTTAPDDPDPRDPPPTTPTTIPPDDECAATPPALRAKAAALRSVSWVSNVRAADPSNSPQHDMPGRGQHLQVAPGRGWIEANGVPSVRDGDCRWNATWVRANWSELRPWVASERRDMLANTDTRHLVTRWDALNADQQGLFDVWPRPAVQPGSATCAVADAMTSRAADRCDWTFRNSAAFSWQADVCFELESDDGGAGVHPPLRHPVQLPGWFGIAVKGRSVGQAPGAKPSDKDRCWVTAASGVDWIRKTSDHADGRITTQGTGGTP